MFIFVFWVAQPLAVTDKLVLFKLSDRPGKYCWPDVTFVLTLTRVSSGLLVVSSTEAVPVEQFIKLSQEQHRIQHSGEYTSPKWFIPNTLKYYVLLHDMGEGDEQR